MKDIKPIEPVEFENAAACLLACDFMVLLETAMTMQAIDRWLNELDPRHDATYAYRASQRGNNAYKTACNTMISNIRKGLYNET